METHPAVLADPEEPLVLVDSLGAATVNLRAYFWFDGHAHSVFRVRSALLRLIKQALTDNGISMPDEAREVVFPKGVPVVYPKAADREAATDPRPVHIQPVPTRPAPQAEEPDVSATEAEGDLASEQPTLERHGATAEIPDPADDLLSRQP